MLKPEYILPGQYKEIKNNSLYFYSSLIYFNLLIIIEKLLRKIDVTIKETL